MSSRTNRKQNVRVIDQGMVNVRLTILYLF